MFKAIFGSIYQKVERQRRGGLHASAIDITPQPPPSAAAAAVCVQWRAGLPQYKRIERCGRTKARHDSKTEHYNW